MIRVRRFRILRISGSTKSTCFLVLSILLLSFSYFFWNAEVWEAVHYSTDQGFGPDGVTVNGSFDPLVMRRAHISPDSVRKLQEENTCKIPVMNPFEPEMTEFFDLKTMKYFKPSDYDCSGRKSYFQAFVEEDEAKYGNDKPMILLRQDLPTNLTCCYENLRFSRSYPYDQYVSGEDVKNGCVMITGNKTELPWDSQYVIVNCAEKTDIVNVTQDGNEFVFSNQKFVENPNGHSEILFYIPNKFQNERLQFQSEKLPHEPLNVIIMGYDQISRLNLIRMMSKSFEFLKSDLDAIDLQGYNKAGDSTLNNTLAFMTGFDFAGLSFTANFDFSYGRVKGKNKNKFDCAPFIWKDFAEKGYATAYSDDSISIFDYQFDGFTKQPTHVYLHPFNRWYYDTYYPRTRWRRQKLGRDHCIGNQRIVDFLQHHAVKVSRAFRDRPYFHFMWSTLNAAKHVPALLDQTTVTTLKYFKEAGVLNKSLVILLSDHGWRTGDIMLKQGKLETLMPFAFLLLPKWFQDEYPLAYRNLKENQFRLTTPYDIHTTLEDILTPEVSLRNGAILKRQRETRTRNGVSLFLQVPKERTCEEAGIAQVYCSCLAYKKLDPGSTALTRLGNFAVETINSWLKLFPPCKPYTLDKVISAQVKVASRLKLNRDVLDVTSENQTFKIAFSAQVSRSESAAMFEVVIFTTPRYWTFNGDSRDDIRMSTDIFRMNSYVDTGCIRTFAMKKICTC